MPVKAVILLLPATQGGWVPDVASGWVYLVASHVGEDCAFTGDRPLPVVVVDDAIYRRLPAFLVATVDKFASLPWVERAGAFFGHVDREDQWGFYGPVEPKEGKRLHNGWRLDPPDLVIQDELHLISGPLGTVAGLYETALDRLSAREQDGKVIRPKIVASTATVRRAGQQIQALFDPERTEVFPPPAPDRHHSFFAETVCADESPARLYVGLAAQGKGPKLVFLRALVTLLAAGMHEQQAVGGTADPYMTAVCYFNALTGRECASNLKRFAVPHLVQSAIRPSGLSCSQSRISVLLRL